MTKTTSEFYGSSPEDEYFFKQNKELIEKYRKKLDSQRREQESEFAKELHWMKCPKCGHDLKEVNMSDVMVDSCQHCGGMFLDQGELDLLKEAGNFKSFFTVLNELVTPKKTP